MKKKLVAMVLSGVLAVTALAGCGGDSGGGSKEPAETTAAGEESKGETKDKGYEGTTISVVVCNSSFMKNIQDSLPEFEDATGIKVNFESLQDSQVSNKVAVGSAAGGKDIDVFGYRPIQENLLYIQNGWLASLDDLIKSDPDFDYEDFIESARDLTSQDGTAYGIPYMTEREILYLNMDLLEKAGYKEGPKTYDELLEYCKKLNDPDNGVYAMALRGEGNSAVTQFSGFLRGFGGDFFDEERNATMNSPEAIKALQYYGKLCSEYCAPGVLNNGWQESMNLFTQGLAAMRIDADSQYAFATDKDSSLIADKVGYGMFPEGPKGAKPFNVTAWALGIGANSQHKEACWEFIKWATGKEMDVEGQKAGNSSARTSTWENKEAVSAFPGQLIDVINDTNPVGVATDRPYMVDGGEARNIIGELIVTAIQGISDEELQAKADEANVRLQELLDAEKK